MSDTDIIILQWQHPVNNGADNSYGRNTVSFYHCTLTWTHHLPHTLPPSLPLSLPMMDQSVDAVQTTVRSSNLAANHSNINHTCPLLFSLHLLYTALLNLTAVLVNIRGKNFKINTPCEMFINYFANTYWLQKNQKHIFSGLLTWLICIFFFYVHSDFY